jgi:hypothetical protein
MDLSGGGEICWLKHWGFSVEILLLFVLFGSTFWETIFLVEGYLLFVFLSFGSF